MFVERELWIVQKKVVICLDLVFFDSFFPGQFFRFVL